MNVSKMFFSSEKNKLISSTMLTECRHQQEEWKAERNLDYFL